MIENQPTLTGDDVSAAGEFSYKCRPRFILPVCTLIARHKVAYHTQCGGI